MCQPFAGSAPRAGDPELDAANGAALAASAKNRHEHQLVIDTMRAALEPLCDELTIAAEPQLSRTAAVWHLCTPISGRLRETSTTAIDLALALHPTPAVGGVPTRAASELIAELEGDRGFYAGAVGWCDASGDGRWVVSIRCAQLSADRRTALAHAGGGIVAESDPDDEVDETTTKFATILTALGVEQSMTENIRRATPEDTADITEMIHELAEFERAADQCTVTETQLPQRFSAPPTVHGHVAEVDGEAAAMALWFLNFSTWDGVAGIYLEDLFVRPGFGVAAWPARCWRRWPPNASTTATPACRGRC